MRETELYTPIKQFLEAQGYEVKGEVKDCDVAAVRDGQLVVVELKPRFNLELVFQGMERQRIADAVYLAIVAPRGRRAGRWAKVRRLCSQLGLGLITVRVEGDTTSVEVVDDPAPPARTTSKKGRSLLLKEFAARSGDHNVGGSTRRPVVTAYREMALRVAHQLRINGPSRLDELRQATGYPRVEALLQRDHYGWFVRLARGVYAITSQGEAALVLYADVVGVLGKGEVVDGGHREEVASASEPPGAG